MKRSIIFLETSADTFSGGRYHAFMLAHALNRLNHDVHVVSKNVPVFFDDLAPLSDAGNIKFVPLTDNQIFFPSGPFDYVFLVPMGSNNPFFYETAKGFASARGAKLVLINFESGNWYNEENPFKKDIAQWLPWREATEVGATILSSALISERYAKKFYRDRPTKTRFAVWSPAINDFVLPDPEAVIKRERSIVAMTRVGSPHKGARDLLYLIGSGLEGWSLDLIMGSPSGDEAYADELQARCEKYEVAFTLHRAVSDRRKYEIIAEASVLAFPSYFEGYGYPPVEAISSGTHCVAYDLPVLKEICGNSIFYVEPGDVTGMRQAIIMTSNIIVTKRATFSGFRERTLELETLLEREVWPVAHQSFTHPLTESSVLEVNGGVVIDIATRSETALTIVISLDEFEAQNCLAHVTSPRGDRIIVPLVRDVSSSTHTRFIISLSTEIFDFSVSNDEPSEITFYAIDEVGRVLSKCIDVSELQFATVDVSDEVRVSVPKSFNSSLFVKGYGWPAREKDFANIGIGGSLNAEWKVVFGRFRPDLENKANTAFYALNNGRIGYELYGRQDTSYGLHAAILTSSGNSSSRTVRVNSAVIDNDPSNSYDDLDAFQSQGILRAYVAHGEGFSPTFRIDSRSELLYAILYDGVPFEVTRTLFRGHSSDLGFYIKSVASIRDFNGPFDINKLSIIIFDDFSRVVSCMKIGGAILEVDLNQDGQLQAEFRSIAPYCAITKFQKLSDSAYSLECEFISPERYDTVQVLADNPMLSFSPVKLLVDMSEGKIQIEGARISNLLSCSLLSADTIKPIPELLDAIIVAVSYQGKVLHSFKPTFKDILK